MKTYGGIDDVINFSTSPMDVIDADNGDMWSFRRKAGSRYSLKGLGDVSEVSQTTNSDGSITTTYSDGSYAVNYQDGSANYYNADGTLSYNVSSAGVFTSASAPTSTSATAANSSTDSGGSVLQSIESFFTTVAPTAVQLEQQTQLNALNITRAQQGLPPISSSVIAPTMDFGLSSQTLQYVLFGVLGLGLLAMLGKRKSPTA